MTDIKLHFKNESGKYECNYCGHVLAASTSPTRLRAHLIGAPNAGTKICPNVPDDVRISLGGINKRQKTATGYILPSPSNLPPVETKGMAEATTALVLPPNGSGANNYLGNQGRLPFLPQQHTMPLQHVAHFPLGETSEGTIGLAEAVMPPNETSSNPHQIESGANNDYIPFFSPELNNDFGNQGWELPYMMLTHPNESGSDENLPLPNEMIGRTTQLQHQFTTEYLPPNESCSNLEPEAFPPTDLVTQDLRNCYLTVDTDQHGMGDAEIVQQEVQMVEGNRVGEGSAFQTNRLGAEATTALVLPPNGSGANNYLGNQGPLRFMPQQHTMPLQHVAHFPLGETSEGTIGLAEALMPPNETSSNPHQIESGANNHCLPFFSPELNNDFGSQGQENQLRDDEIDVLQEFFMSTHPNVPNFQAGEPSEGVERGSTHQPDPLTTTDLLLPNESGTRPTTPPNESCGNLEPESFPYTDLITQDLRNCCLTVDADQHGMGDAEIVQQEVQMGEGNQVGEGSAFQTNRLVGEAFVKNEGKIWSWLMDDQVLRVGIYGMGGVGKTTLMKQIQTRLKGQNSFKVYWVTVSQNFSIRKFQNLIAQKINLNFSDKEDEEGRTEELTQALQEKGKCVLILDDLWNYFDVEDVGIPVKAGGCKLVLTTRLLNVCQKMDCNEGNIIQVQALSRLEAWILFTKELGNYSTEVEREAKLIAIECDGLPLGIRVMARSMKGIRELHSWRNAREELRESKLSKGHEMREEVFPVLKFSYLHLNDPSLQKCLLYCALFPEDHKISRDELIEYMIVEGIIDAKKSRRAEFDRGHSMLDTLVNACLLEGNTRDVWMHDLIRDMAVYELRERSNTLVEAGAQLKELPDVEEWTENLECASLMYNDIKVIPSGHTPRCPNLSTLLLRKNGGLIKIAGSFLKQFQKLKVLDLSGCSLIKKLPVYVSDLVNLTALLLCECARLRCVPSLAKLERLKKLDLSGCGKLKWMPEGVELLINLKHLDLSSTRIKRIVPKLSRLQVLNLGSIWETRLSVKGKEVGRLEKLESLECSFDDTKEWRKYMKSREKSQQSLTHYAFRIGKLFLDDDSSDFDDDWQCDWQCDCHNDRQNDRSKEDVFDDWRSTSAVYLLGGEGSSSNDYVAMPLPTDIQALIIERDLNGSLWDTVLALKYTTQLHFLRLDRCDGIARLVTAPWDNLCGLSEVEKGTTNTIATTPFLSNLKSIEIEKCHKFKNLYPAHLLPNLQKIRVWDCSGMEEVFGTDQEGEQVGLNLPQLIKLELSFLPELRSIYNGVIICHSLEQIRLDSCPKLERITFPLPQRSLWRIRVSPKEWWESLKWGSANDKIHLDSLLDFPSHL